MELSQQESTMIRFPSGDNGSGRHAEKELEGHRLEKTDQTGGSLGDDRLLLLRQPGRVGSEGNTYSRGC